jgi:hypothetical protein
MAAGDEAPVANAPSGERNEAKPQAPAAASSADAETKNGDQKPGNNSRGKGKKGDRGRGEWRCVIDSSLLMTKR